MPNPSGPMLQCDFCRSRQLRWRYPAHTFELPQWRDEQGRAWGSYGDWAACEQCADEIEADRWDLVTARSILQMQEKLQSTDPEIAARIASIHAGFREHRHGKRRPVVPPTPPTTMAGVYSRALDLQADLVRYLSRTETLRGIALEGLLPREAHAELMRLIYACVAQATAGYVSPLVCSLLEQTSGDLPDTRLDAPDLLTPNGFLMLATPLVLPIDAEAARADHASYASMPIRAISWYTFAPDGESPIAPNGGIFLATWVIDEPSRPNALQVGSMGTWPFRASISEAVASNKTESGTQATAAVCRWLAALNAFCRQQLITGRRGQPERSTRRRFEREQHRSAPDVLVVELRRTQQRTDHEPTGRKIGQDFSFSVSGHWRNAWYETIQDHRPIFIAPYVKGNLSAPLRPRRRVFAIVH